MSDMNAEYEDLIASFRIADDLEQAVQTTIHARLEEFQATPLTALPFGCEEELVEQPQSLRIKRVESRVIQRLRAA
jgi:hypothetical protein